MNSKLATAAQPLRERLKTGLVFGGGFALYGGGLLFVLLLGTWIIEGTSEIRVRSGLMRLDLAVLLYPAGAIATGLLFFGLAPLMRWRVTALILGALSFLPWTFAVAYVLNEGYRRWTEGHTAVALVCALLLGGFFGIAMRPAIIGRTRKSERRHRRR